MSAKTAFIVAVTTCYFGGLLMGLQVGFRSQSREIAQLKLAIAQYQQGELK